MYISYDPHEKIPIDFLNGINRLEFLMGADCVFYEVGTDFM
jgi:hypothetical protein